MADSPVERLIDQGLERYGKGDLDGALVAWESALALNPDDARAAGYVEYVRGHYDLLRGQGGAEAESELAVPFGLADLHESDRYEIEISLADAERAKVEAYLEHVDRVDDGWFLDEDSALPTIARPLPLPARPDSVELPAPPLALELEADEPDPDADDVAPAIGPYTQPRATSNGDDDQTRDFGPARLSRLADFEGVHPFDDPADTRSPAAPTASASASADDRGEGGDGDGDGGTGEFDYHDETAEVGKRNLGFVKLTGGEPADVPPPVGFAGPQISTLQGRRAKVDQVPLPRPSLEPPPAQPDPAADLELPDPGARLEPIDRLDKSSTLDLGAPGELDLGLPTPPAAGTAPPAAPAAASAGASGDDDERTQERGQWARARSPRATSGTALDHLDLDDGGSPSIAPPVIIDDPVMNDPGSFGPAHRNMPTRELPGFGQRPAAAAPGAAPRDTATRELPPLKSSTPTRDFPPVPTSAKTIPRGARVAAPPPPREDLAPLDPTPHAATGLLAAIDAAAPAGESADDRTRRRINALLDRAVAASKDGRHPDAVAACDLALAEAPDSAVAQKLVHRSRDAILGVYQGFLGDLGARPSLAVPMHELPREQIDPRAAFLLSRVDGNLTFEEILDVSGMTRLEALRHLARLVGRGILSVR